ncbi:MAG: hypothetical protein AAF141_04805 [Pseudomonadota bacterium]
MKRLLTFATGLISAFALSACGGLSGRVGLASCTASERGECPEINDRTLFIRDTSLLTYYDPDGTFYRLGSTEIIKGQWQVDETGTQLTTHLFAAGKFGPQPLNDYMNRGTSLQGDPGLLSENSRGFFIPRFTEQPLDEIISQVRAR